MAIIIKQFRHAMRAVSFVMVLKGAVGGALTLVAALGVAVPQLWGIAPTHFQQGAAISVGAIIGAALTLRG